MATVFPSIYRAKATRWADNKLTVLVPQIFGEAPVTVTDFTGTPTTGMGWVLFQGGNPEFPVWLGRSVAATSGSGETGPSLDEVWIGPDPPPDEATELWIDTDVTIPPGSEATDVMAGVVELATPAEATAQTDNTRAVTPLGLADRLKTTGGTLTGPLVLSGAPSTALHPATKAYVDLNAFDVTPLSRTWASVGGAGSTLTTNNGWVYWIPVRCPSGLIDGLGIEVTTAGAAGSVSRLGIWSNHASRLEPYALVKDAGTVDSTTIGWKSATFASVSWPGGMMWLGVAAQGTGTPTYRAVTGHGEPWILFAVDQVPPALSYRAWTQAVAGAFPATATPGLAASTNPKVAFHTP